jgi:hypothetical protein
VPPSSGDWISFGWILRNNWKEIMGWLCSKVARIVAHQKHGKEIEDRRRTQPNESKKSN